MMSPLPRSSKVESARDRYGPERRCDVVVRVGPASFSVGFACRCLLALALCAAAARSGQGQSIPASNFDQRIAPLLIRRCVECHQGSDPSGGLVLTGREGLVRGGDSGPAFDARMPGKSLLLERVRSGEMPPEEQGHSRRLPESELRLLEEWFRNGAAWPAGRQLDLFERTTERRAGRDWWSLQPVQRPAVPDVGTALASANPIDAFVLQRLAANQMQPAPRADPVILLRRLCHVLVGLPPTREQRERFRSQPFETAWQTTVEELLASPQYGVRWARHWLDVVRYADTSGYERDQEKPFAWKYRDWVVDALNSDMSYRRFIEQQLAGDELPDRTLQTVIATGFLRLGTWNDEPNDPADYQYDRLEDLVHTTSSAFLAMTVKCARCHQHKFDPITQEDYYRMASAFWPGPILARDRKLLGGPTVAELGYQEVLGWTDLGANPPDLHVLRSGQRHQPLYAVRPASLSMIPELEFVFEPPSDGAQTTGRRSQLARWITDPRHPLTPRVMVNRLWLHHFGAALVRSPNNFGFLADPPTHPELLDWLAAEFMEGGWTLKRMHRLIVNSRAWQQSAMHPLAEEYSMRDASNRLWWRANRRRLDAETLRDGMLAVSGELDRRMGGPGFRPAISPEALEGLSRKSAAWNPSPPGEQLRRSLYLFSKRGLLPPLMTTFDFCDTTQSNAQRDFTTVPTQALTLLNNQFVHGRSAALARRLVARTGSDAAQVESLWQTVLGRKPDAAEQRVAIDHVQRQRQRFEHERAHRDVDRGNQIARQSTQLSEALVLHLRADQGVRRDANGRVDFWKDLSGEAHHARQPDARHRPMWQSDGFNEQPVLDFDGEQRFLQLDGQLLRQQDCTILAVVTDRGLNGHREIISNWNGSVGNSVKSLFLGLTAERTVRFSDAFGQAGQVPAGDAPFLLAAISEASDAAVFWNSRELARRGGRLPERNLSTGWVIGQQGNIGGEYWNGGLAELRVYRRALSRDERQQVERVMGNRHGISLPELDPERSVDSKELAWASLAHVLLNSNEFLYVD